MKKIVVLFILVLLSACGSQMNSENLVNSVMQNDYKNDDKTAVLFTVSMRHTPENHTYVIDEYVPLIGTVPSAKFCIGYESRMGNDGYIDCAQNIPLDYTQANQKKIYGFETDSSFIFIDGLQYMFPEDRSVYKFNRSFLTYTKHSFMQNNMIGQKIYIGHFDINFVYNEQHKVNIAYVDLIDDYDNFIKTISKNGTFAPNIQNAFKNDFLEGKIFNFKNSTLTVKKDPKIGPFNR